MNPGRSKQLLFCYSDQISFETHLTSSTACATYIPNIMQQHIVQNYTGHYEDMKSKGILNLHYRTVHLDE